MAANERVIKYAKTRVKLAEAERRVVELEKAFEEEKSKEKTRLQEARNKGWINGMASAELLSTEFHDKEAIALSVRVYRDCFYLATERAQRLGALREGVDVTLSLLNIYSDVTGSLDDDDEQDPDRSNRKDEAVRAYLFKMAILVRDVFITFSLEPHFGKPVKVDPVFFRSATFRASSGPFTFLIHFSLPLQFRYYRRPILQLESCQHFDAQGVPVKSRNLTEFPWSPRWEPFEMAKKISDFLADEILNFKNYCSQLNQG